MTPGLDLLGEGGDVGVLRAPGNSGIRVARIGAVARIAAAPIQHGNHAVAPHGVELGLLKRTVELGRIALGGAERLGVKRLSPPDHAGHLVAGVSAGKVGHRRPVKRRLGGLRELVTDRVRAPVQLGRWRAPVVAEHRYEHGGEQHQHANKTSSPTGSQIHAPSAEFPLKTSSTSPVRGYRMTRMG